VYLFRRPKGDEGDDEGPRLPADDAGDFCLSEAQRRIRKNAETRKMMEKLWAQIEERWRDPWKQG
jgi:hypothetical protein